MSLSFNNEKMRPVRAVLAILIVLGHFSYFMEGDFVKGMRVAGPVSVAFFLFISGYGLTCSMRTKGGSYLKRFPLSKLIRIVLPALLVCFLHVLLCGNGGVSLFSRIGLVFSCGNTLLPHYWFVWAILFDYLLFYFSWRLFPRRWTKYMILAGVIVFLLVTILRGFDRCWWMCALSFPAGIFFSEFEQPFLSFAGMRESRYWLSLFVLALLFVGLYLVPFLWVRTLAYAIGPFFLALCVARLPIDRTHLPVLGFLGAISYEIYLSHITIMSFLRGDVVWISHRNIYVVVVFALTILVAWLIHLLCDRLLKRVR